MAITEVPLPSYDIIECPERTATETHDITGYAVNADLGRGIGVVAVVKWTNQIHHDEYLRSLLSDGWDASRGLSHAPNNRARARYYDGLVVRTDLDKDYIGPDNSCVTDMLQPTGFDIRADGTEVFASADTLLLALGRTTTSTVTHPLFARLHSAEFDASGQHVLTASSALDMIYEVDAVTGRPVWSLDVWEETPFRENTFGQKLYRYPSIELDGHKVLRNPDPLYMKDNPDTLGATCIIDAPDRYRGLGLPTALMPAFVNSVSYGPNDTVLATSYQRGEGWIIDRQDKQINILAKDMKRPHGLHTDPLLDGYIVTDTIGEKVLFIDGDNSEELVVDFNSLPDMKPGLEKAGWLQYTTRIAPDTYCAVLTSRQKLVIFDPVRQLRREIALDPDWGVQLVSPSLKIQG